MKKYRKLSMLLGLYLLISLFAGQGYAQEQLDRTQWPYELKIHTGAAGGQWDSLGNAMAQVLTKNILPTSTRLGGAVANITKINDNSNDIGFSISCFLGKDTGQNVYSDIRTDNTVLLANLYPQILYILIREDFAQKHGIDNMESLLQIDSTVTPVHFATLKKGTGSQFLLSMLLKYGYHTSFDALRKKGWKIYFNNYAEIADKFVNKELDCFVYTAGPQVPLILSMEKFIDIKILPISQPTLQSLKQRLHTDLYTLEPGMYDCVTDPVVTLSDFACLVAPKHLPDTLVYAINEAIWNNKNYIGKNVKDFLSFSPETALQGKMEKHPGSVKFWKTHQKE